MIMTYKGFMIDYWCGCYHADNGQKRIRADREADLFNLIDDYTN